MVPSSSTRQAREAIVRNPKLHIRRIATVANVQGVEHQDPLILRARIASSKR
ncbi:MAG: hypothetical protein HRT36_07345 [Alphaproteobacteria bacterium]|nr:hypothetical protein [Alphaproteobacteria bacterium]